MGAFASLVKCTPEVRARARTLLAAGSNVTIAGLARVAALQQTDERVRRGWLDPSQGVGIVVIERRLLAADGQIRAGYIGPAAVVVEGDVDAVVVGAERFLEECGRANSEARIAAPCLYRNMLVVDRRRSARQHH